MNKLLLLFAFFLLSCNAMTQNSSKEKKTYKIEKTTEEWKKIQEKKEQRDKELEEIKK